MGRLSYYATKISDNISRTPEGYLLCRNCVLGRTGFQTYAVNDVTKDLSSEEIRELGLENANPNSSINLYRPSDEVFSAATIASAEGKPLTDEHPHEFVNPENFRQYVRGHVQNVHKGSEVLDSGDWPLIGDILVTDAEVIDKVENGIRELSCGYSHELKLDGDKICQVKIVVNHVALVRKGRAGPEARINDSAQVIEPETKVIVGRSAGSGLKSKDLEKKMAKDKGNVFTRLLGLGIRAMANDEDTSPEELAEATKELHERSKEDAKKDDKMHDAHKHDMHKKDLKCVPGVRGHEECEDGACMYDAKHEDRHMKDRRMEDEEDRMAHHKMLDRVLDRMEKGYTTKDSDLETLRKLLNEFLEEEEKEPAHAKDRRADDKHADDEEEEKEDMRKEDRKADDKHADDDDSGDDPKEGSVCDDDESDVIEPVMEEDDEDEEVEAEEEEKMMVKNDAAMNLLPLVEKSRSKAIQKAYDSALESALDNEKMFLNKFRPFVAKSQDRSLISAFNGETRRVNGRSKSSDSSYTGFGKAAKVRPKQNDGEAKYAYSDLESAYAKILKGEVN